MFEFKVGAVVGASLLIFAALWSLPDDPGALRELVRNPPVYSGHLRHFNNDQLPAIAFCNYFLSLARGQGARIAWFAVLTAMGFLMAWSGGRGIMLSVSIFLILVSAFRVLPLRAVAHACGALVLGVVLVLAFDQSDLSPLVLHVVGLAERNIE